MQLRILAALVIAGGLLAAGAVTQLAPQAGDLPEHTADVKNGERIFHIGGCISCHRGEGDLPSGGKPFVTPIGTLYPPNLTPDPETGIGGWSNEDFVNAVMYGVAPDGHNYIPAFPYASYHKMKVEDVLDLRAYLGTLAPVKAENKPAEIRFEWLIRPALSAWRWLALTDAPDGDDSRGAYLVNGPGHCAECHTPRNLLMVTDASRAFAGGPHPDGKGKVPSLRDLVGRGRFASADDLASALSLGEAGGYDHLASGGMGEVQSNISQLPEDDIKAIADYLVSLK